MARPLRHDGTESASSNAKILIFDDWIVDVDFIAMVRHNIDRTDDIDVFGAQQVPSDDTT